MKGMHCNWFLTPRYTITLKWGQVVDLTTGMSVEAKRQVEELQKRVNVLERQNKQLKRSLEKEEEGGDGGGGGSGRGDDDGGGGGGKKIASTTAAPPPRRPSSSGGTGRLVFWPFKSTLPPWDPMVGLASQPH